MMDHTHVADGTATKLLLAALVVASGAIGGLGLAAATSSPAASGVDGATAAFPIDNVTVGTNAALLSMDGKGNDPFPPALTSVRAAVQFGYTLAYLSTPDELPQDMDPY